VVGFAVTHFAIDAGLLSTTYGIASLDAAEPHEDQALTALIDAHDCSGPTERPA
jgi:hypothetical protein